MHDDLERARFLIEVGRLREALDLLDRASGASPDDPTLHVLRSACLLDMERPAEALAAAERACALDPERGRAHAMRASALRRLGAPPASVVDTANLAVRYEPEYVGAWEQLVTALVLAKHQPEAERCLADMRARFPSDVETEVAASIVEVGRPTRIDGLIRVLASPLGRVILILLAISGGGLVVYLGAVGLDRASRRGAGRRAQRAIERALANEPDSYRLQRMLAHFYEEQGRYLAALDLQVRMGQAEPRPELVERVLSIAHRGLVGITAAIVAVAALAGGTAVAAMADGGLPVALGVPLVVALVVAAGAGWVWARRRWLGRLPAGVASRIRLLGTR